MLEAVLHEAVVHKAQAKTHEARFVDLEVEASPSGLTSRLNYIPKIEIVLNEIKIVLRK